LEECEGTGVGVGLTPTIKEAKLGFKVGECFHGGWGVRALGETVEGIFYNVVVSQQDVHSWEVLFSPDLVEVVPESGVLGGVVQGIYS